MNTEATQTETTDYLHVSEAAKELGISTKELRALARRERMDLGAYYRLEDWARAAGR